MRSVVLAAALIATGCADKSRPDLAPQLPDGGVDDVVVAEQWLERDAALPTRAEVVAVTDPANAASQNVLRKSGLIDTGPRRAYCMDLPGFAITKTRWLETQAA